MLGDSLVLGCQTVDEVRGISIHDFADRDLDPDELAHILRLCGAYWQYQYPADPSRAHAELTSGMCSDGFVNVLGALIYPNVRHIIAVHLVRKLRRIYPGLVHWVVGSDHAGAAIALAVADLLGAKCDFTEKGLNKAQIWQRHPIGDGEVVLQVEDLITTSSTFDAVRAGIQAGTPHPVTFAPVSLVVVNRSSFRGIDGAPLEELLRCNIETWAGPFQPIGKNGPCPLCAVGSPRVRPKQNWAQLTG